jgi:hypothetical protein
MLLQLRKPSHPQQGQLLQPLSNNSSSSTQALPHAGLAAAHQQQLAEYTSTAAPHSQSSNSSSIRTPALPHAGLAAAHQQQLADQAIMVALRSHGSRMQVQCMPLAMQQQQQVLVSPTLTTAPVPNMGMLHLQQQQLPPPLQQQQQQIPLSASMLGSEMSLVRVFGVQQQQQQALQSARMLGDALPLVNMTYARLLPPPQQQQQQQLSLPVLGSPMAAMQPLQHQQQQQFFVTQHPLQQPSGMLQAQQQQQQQHADMLQPQQRQQQVHMLQVVGQPGPYAAPQLAQQHIQYNTAALAEHSAPLSMIMAPRLSPQTLPPVSPSSLSGSACIGDASLQLLQNFLQQQQQQLSAAAKVGFFGPGGSGAQQLAASGPASMSGQLLVLQRGQAAAGVWQFAADQSVGSPIVSLLQL